MKAPNFVPYSFRDAVSGVEAGLHGELAAQSYDECLAVAMFVAAEAPFRRLSFKRLSALQYVADAIPQVRLAEGLNRLDIGITPWLVVKPDGTPFAIVDKRMRMRLTRNLSEEERQAVLNYDFSKMDDCRRNRVSFYLSEYGLPSGDLDLPLLSQEEYHRLKGKCANVREGLALPMLRSDGRQLPIFDDGDTVTIVDGEQSHMNPLIYNADLGFGLLLPLSEAFADALNDGSVRNFTYTVNPAGNGQLEIRVSFTIDEEVITDSAVRKATVYNGGAFVGCSFGSFGALLLSNDATLTVSPSENTMVPCFSGNSWRVTRIRGGIRYVSICRGAKSVGVVELPATVKRPQVNSATVAFDLGDTSCCGVMFYVPGNPVPIQFDAAKDIFPLIEVSPTDRDALCNGSWFPVSFSGTARSISQMFRDAEGNLFDTPAPYMACRPFIDLASGYSIARTRENDLYAGFKSRGMIRCQADEEQADAYAGSTAGILLIGLQQALQFTDSVKLRLSHPNNPAYKESFVGHIKQVLNLIRDSLTDANGKGFVFSDVEFIDEASCNVAGIYSMGINGTLGAQLENNIGIDMGGSTTDVSVCTFGNKRILLPAIPIAGRVVSLSSLIQVARAGGLTNAFREIPEGMHTVIHQQINPIIRKLMGQGLETKTALEQMVYDPELMEAMQTLLDYFSLKLNSGKSQLLQSLVCFKNLIVEDIVLHQASRFYTDTDLKAGKLFLLCLGNGSRCVSLICDESNHYSDSRAVLEQILQARAVHHIGQKARLTLIHNQQPKTEVSNGLACYESKDDASIEHWQDNASAGTLKELKEQHLDAAIQRIMELAEWLNMVVPRICGDVHPLYSGLTDGFGQLLKGLEDQNQARVVLCDTITHENGRFGSVHQMSASMAVDVWVAFAIMDHVNRNLSMVQTAQM